MSAVPSSGEEIIDLRQCKPDFDQRPGTYDEEYGRSMIFKYLYIIYI